jgi:Spy/CpxP family protein refolding chaperone
VALVVGLTWYAVPPAAAQEAADQQGAGLAARIQGLHLTDEQQAKIEDIRKEHKPKIEAARAQLAALVKEQMEKARGFLTPEQQTRLQAMKDERKEHRIEGLAAKLAHLKQLDLTDDEVAKIQEIRKEYHPKLEAALRNIEGLLTPQQKEARLDALKAGKNRREIFAALNLTGEQKEKCENVTKEVGGLVREELAKMGDLLTEEQQAKLAELKDERRDRVRDRLAAGILNFKELNLTPDQRTKLTDLRQEYRPRIHEAGNRLRAAAREEVAAIIAVLKG